MTQHVQTVIDWRNAVKGKPALDLTSQAEMLLRVYHRLSGPEIAERERLLNQMIAVASTYTRSNSAGAAYFATFTSLGMQAEKQLATMAKAGKSWGVARKIFAPAGAGAHGKTNALQHYGKHAATPTSKQNYWLEGLDPKHRSWGHMPPKFFNDWMADAANTKNFFDWLEEKGLGQTLPQVQYLAPDERWKYMCVFGNDKVIYRHQTTLSPRGNGDIPLERFTTYGLETAHSGDNYAIWVCSPGGVFYTNTHKVSEFHHSTFLAGGRVLAAGEWVVAAGKLLLISHKTGHHAASPVNLYSAMKLLADRVDLSRTVVHIVDFATHSEKFITANEFMTNSGNFGMCAEIRDNLGNVQDMKALAQFRCKMHQDWDLNMTGGVARGFTANPVNTA